jgi:tripartite-type tricarboxylate transporter receptor subunit TctC
MSVHCPKRIGALLAALFVIACANGAAADPGEDFYRGKQIRIVIRAEPGGNYDIYSRLLMRHMLKHVPGKPIAIPVNMPGGSGLTALNYIAEVGPKDGTLLTIVTQTFPVEQALGLNKNLKIDVRKLNWIGNMSESNTFLLTSQRSETRTIEDSKRRETIMGVPSTADVTAWLTAVLNNTLGTKFALVAGYPSGPAMNLAMERGEVEGRGTTNPRTMFTGAGNVESGKAAFNLLLQSGLHKDKDYPNVPLLADLATDPDQRVVFDYFSKMGSLARPVAMAEGVPPERVAIMRDAFAKTMQDPEFLAEASQQSMEIALMSGEEVQKIVNDIVDAPAAIIDRVRSAIQVKGAKQLESNAADKQGK